MRHDIKHVDVGILTVFGKELQAMRKVLGLHQYPDKKWSTNYWEGKVTSARCKRDFTVVLAAIGTEGDPEAGSSASEMIQAFNPQVVILVGIARPVSSESLPGDVVLSERLWAAEPTSGSRISRSMQQDIVAYLDDSVRTRLDPLFQQLDIELGLSSENLELMKDGGKVLKGCIASWDSRSLDSEALAILRQQNTSIAVSEMAAYGVETACHARKVDWLAVRGISILNDGNPQAESVRGTVARRAAAVAIDFIKNGLELPIRKESSPSPGEESSHLPTWAGIIAAVIVSTGFAYQWHQGTFDPKRSPTPIASESFTPIIAKESITPPPPPPLTETPALKPLSKDSGKIEVGAGSAASHVMLYREAGILTIDSEAWSDSPLEATRAQVFVVLTDAIHRPIFITQIYNIATASSTTDPSVAKAKRGYGHDPEERLIIPKEITPYVEDFDICISDRNDGPDNWRARLNEVREFVKNYPDWDVNSKQAITNALEPLK